MIGKPRAVLLLVLVFGLACASGNDAKVPAGSAPTAVKVVTVGEGAFDRTLEVVGTIEAVDTVILQPEAAGVVVAIEFADGDTVDKGDVLLRFRADAPRAKLADADARLTLADAKLQRIVSLRASGDASQQELDTAKADKQLAEASVALARDEVRKTEVRAPFAGRLGKREVSVGATVTPATPLVRLDRLDVVAIDGSVPERKASLVAEGQRALVKVTAFPDDFLGTISYVAPRIDENTRTVPFRATIDNPDGRLLPGMTGRVTVVTETVDKAILVPTEAVVEGANGPSIYVVDAESKAEARPVTLGQRMDDEIEVIDGIHAGDQIVVEGLVRLAPGMSVAATERQ